jgi:hypothetical protein
MATNVLKKLGYAGSLYVNGYSLLMTSGGADKEYSIPYMNMMSVPPSSSSRSRVQQADGTRVWTANVSFDVTNNAMSLFSAFQLLQRRHSFTVDIYDGETGVKLTGCYLTSLSLSGSPGGLITGSLSCTSPNASLSSAGATPFIRNHEPYGYWYSGNTDVREWTFTMTQDVTPVYTNEDSIYPRYLRVGLVEYSLDVTTYLQLQQHDAVSVVTKTFTLSGTTQRYGYSFNGVTELGTYSHTFATHADMDDGSGGTILTIA